MNTKEQRCDKKTSVSVEHTHTYKLIVIDFIYSQPKIDDVSERCSSHFQTLVVKVGGMVRIRPLCFIAWATLVASLHVLGSIRNPA